MASFNGMIVTGVHCTIQANLLVVVEKTGKTLLHQEIVLPRLSRLTAEPSKNSKVYQIVSGVVLAFSTSGSFSIL
ncbi:MAG: hypothetical protein KDD64_08460 [Bdellovibrionales bacterium]|nr:hypothetical protein [Bdellovibrionales bacterium]